MELNGANAQDAMLWFLARERRRHMDDIAAIEKDIAELMEQGARLPDNPPLSTFIRVPGVMYEKKEP